MWVGLGGEGTPFRPERGQTLAVPEGKRSASGRPLGSVSHLGWLGFSRASVLVRGFYLHRAQQAVCPQPGLWGCRS